MANLSLMWLIYEQILPIMIGQGIEDTPENRQAYLIQTRANLFGEQPDIWTALTTEIIRLGDEIPI